MSTALANRKVMSRFMLAYDLGGSNGPSPVLTRFLIIKLIVLETSYLFHSTLFETIESLVRHNFIKFFAAIFYSKGGFAED